MSKPVTNYNWRTLILASIALLALVGLPFLSNARTMNTPTNVTIANNSNWEIRHVYLQAAGQDTWSQDVLNGTIIAAGSSHTLTGIACDGQSTNMITEDKDGCFLNHTVSCGIDTTWTITNDASPNCGN
jgi:hypothetical protein